MKFSSALILLPLLCVSASATAPTAFAQNALAPDRAPAAERRTPEGAEAALESSMERGRDLLDANDVRAVEILRAAAQSSLGEVTQISAGVSAGSVPAARLARARQTAADAHYLWGQAADQFARRDEAITAYARAISLGTVAGENGKAPTISRSSREARASIGGLLRAGLPLVAPDDALEQIARVAQGGLWVPRRFTFALPPSIAAPSFTAPKTSTVEFLASSGKVFPPENASAASGTSRLTRVPPLFRAVSADALPNSLQMDRVALGYVRESAGPNRGLWRQVVRVFYASDYSTRGNRDDRARAETLCEMFLKNWATQRAALGVENPYVADGVSTLWLMEVSSLWPADDDDPLVKSQLPPKMPDPNTPIDKDDKPLRRAVETSPLSRPWRASAQMDAAPGEILFFKAGFAREESEWLRETMHEYGHVSLAPFGGFAPPLEPYGNGALGETLSVLWASAAPADWEPSKTLQTALLESVPRNEDDDVPQQSARSFDRHPEFDRTLFALALNRHALDNALPALQAWKKDGPFSALRRDSGEAGLRYLAGTSLMIERVWGAPALGAALKTARLKKPTNLRADDLLNAFAETKVAQTQNSQTQNALGNPIWLGGALDQKIDVSSLRERRAVGIPANQARAAWLWVPPGVRGMRVFFTAKASGRTLPNFKVGGLPATPRAERAGYSAFVATGAARGWTKFSFESATPLAIGLAQWEK